MISAKKEPKKPTGLSNKNTGDLGNNSFSGMVWTKGEEIETWSLDRFSFFLVKEKKNRLGSVQEGNVGLKMTFLMMKIKI